MHYTRLHVQPFQYPQPAEVSYMPNALPFLRILYDYYVQLDYYRSLLLHTALMFHNDQFLRQEVPILQLMILSRACPVKYIYMVLGAYKQIFLFD